jgi:superoxide dismutase, Fe-Mn family
MNLQPLPLPFDPAAVRGLSQRLLESHHRNNYVGALKRLSAIRSQLASIDPGGTPGFVLNGLKREELIATNSMLLHELYFSSFGPAPSEMAPAWSMAIEANFGSIDRWRAEFLALGKALGGGSGWVLLSFLPREGTLVNQWAADHTHAVAGAVPILALDMYEHAYHMDFGSDSAAYVEAFTALIDWNAVYERYQQAVHAASESSGATADDTEGALVLDVRRAGIFQSARQMVAGAEWRDPATVQSWAGDLPADRDVVVYCIYGHEVGRATALRLRAAGLRARFLRGGIDRWSAEKRPLQARETGT